MSVEVVHWNPRKPIFRGHFRIGQRVNNFGDLLGPVIANRLLDRAGIVAESKQEERRLLAVGSILRLAGEGDTIWGIGANGKSLNQSFNFSSLDVRAVRGPLTKNFLENRGIAVPDVFGDPGLLVGHLWSRRELIGSAKKKAVAVVPNFHDYPTVPARNGLVNPTSSLWKVIGEIASSDLVVGSSLHGLIVAESLGIPARLVVSGTEPLFKYQDYYEGSGRGRFDPADSIDDAIKMGGEPLPDWDPKPLENAFPFDLWTQGARRRD